MTFRLKLLIIFLLVSIVPLVGISFYGLNVFRSNLESRYVDRLETISLLQKRRIESQIAKDISDTRLIASRTNLRTQLGNFSVTQSESIKLTIKNIIDDVKNSQPNINEITITDVKGKVIASTNEKLNETNLENKEFFAEDTNEPNYKGIVDTTEGKIPEALLTSSLKLEGEIIGYLRVVMAQQELLNITSEYQGLGSTGETILFLKGINGGILSINPLREDENNKTFASIDLKEDDLPFTSALSGEEKQFTSTNDYHGHPILASTRYIDKANWGLLVKIDIEEVISEASQLGDGMVVSILVITIMVFFISLYLLQQLTDPIVKLTYVINKISKGDLKADIADNLINSQDEIGDLAKAFDRTLVSLKLAMKTTGSKSEEKAENSS